MKVQLQLVSLSAALYDQRVRVSRELLWHLSIELAPSIACQRMQPFSRARKSNSRLNSFKRIVLVAVASVLFLCAYWYISINVNGKIRTRSKFYIYPWDQEVINAWPSQFTHHRLSIGQEFRQNYGAGPLVDEVSGMYHTHQYSLFTLVLQRLLESEHRTLNPEEATLFFIPYDLGMDASTRNSDGGLVQTNCPKVHSVMDLLQSSPYFHRKQGADHFLLHTINQMMVYYANEPCTRLYELCMNCTKLSIDTYPPGVFTHLDTHLFMTHKWMSIPFPSNYHISDTTTKFPWRAIAEYPQYMSTIYAMERPYELCFVGSAQVTAKLQRQLRLSLMETCKLMPHLCLLVPLKSHESHERPFEVVDGNNKMQVHNPYSLARFCLTPGGDFPTRKGFFDAMLSGCVPVIFERTAALTQWPLHWRIPRDTALTLRQRAHSAAFAETHDTTTRMHQNAGGDSNTRTFWEDGAEGSATVNVAADCVLFIPRDVAMRNMTDTFEYLARLSRDSVFMATKLRCIAVVGHQMQYSMPRGTGGTSKGTEGVVSGNQKDAVDIFLEHLLNHS